MKEVIKLVDNKKKVDCKLSERASKTEYIQDWLADILIMNLEIVVENKNI